MEDLAYQVRALALAPGEQVVISFKDVLTDPQREKVHRICQEDLNLTTAQVVLLEDAAQISTVNESLESMAVLLADAEKCMAGLVGVVQHLGAHPDATVYERDKRIVEYTRECMDMIRLFLVEHEQPDVREREPVS